MTVHDQKLLPDDEGIQLVPAWMLAPHEEKEVRKRTQDQANEKCAKQFYLFGDCCKKHQLFFSWKCADQKKEMIKCVEFWGREDKYLEQREIYVQDKEQKIIKERDQLRSKGLLE